MPAFITSSPSTMPISLPSLAKTADRLLRLAGYPDHELSILLTDDPGIAQLNETYRKKRGPTNVLAFAMQEGETAPDSGNLLGDIVISVDTAAREAARQQTTVHHRLRVLLTHGLVHLLGYDHERSATDAKIMEEAERGLLHHLQQEERRGDMIKLAVNVDHVATLRQARGINEPDPAIGGPKRKHRTN